MLPFITHDRENQSPHKTKSIQLYGLYPFKKQNKMRKKLNVFNL